MRIEGLWGSSPPTPVWPGSAQTAALFVGLPLLTALVLMATPLHDPGPPPAVEPPAAAVVSEPAPETPADTHQGPAPSFTARQAAVSRPRRPAAVEPVPAVIYETRRELPSRRQPLADARGASLAPNGSVSWLSQELARKCNCVVTLTAAAARGGSRAGTQLESP